MTAPLEHAERISAFVDGELSSAEVDALLDSLENPACRGQLARYARQGARDCPALDISAAVAARIRAEQNQAAPVVGRRFNPVLSRFRRRPSARAWVAASGFAAAASVAVVALNIAPATQQNDVPLSAVPVALAAPASNARTLAAPVSPISASAEATAVAAADKPSRELVIPAPQQRNELDQLYLQHARFRGGYALAAPVSYGRVGTSVTTLPESAAAGN